MATSPTTVAVAKVTEGLCTQVLTCIYTALKLILSHWLRCFWIGYFVHMILSYTCSSALDTCSSKFISELLDEHCIKICSGICLNINLGKITNRWCHDSQVARWREWQQVRDEPAMPSFPGPAQLLSLAVWKKCLIFCSCGGRAWEWG